MTKQEKLNTIIETAKSMVLSGVLLKNVKRHFANLGCSDEIATKLTKIAELEANEFMKNKAA